MWDVRHFTANVVINRERHSARAIRGQIICLKNMSKLPKFVVLDSYKSMTATQNLRARKWPFGRAECQPGIVELHHISAQLDLRAVFTRSSHRSSTPKLNGARVPVSCFERRGEASKHNNPLSSLTLTMGKCGSRLS